ncbi:unnamed protein product [Lepeophtheirus salmonis]|uniref:(salmon louse) hypothetical protein n=1 Tax=Lepeophtheirus salmonis TaxID=72036 RepID=A0A7R8D1D6_LEPSM|nr:unnamed protein product [Lepeophtheirus salmonis]CAF2949570.1 unnamed protein product [Lepeophtheirus salmonis]
MHLINVAFETLGLLKLMLESAILIEDVIYRKHIFSIICPPILSSAVYYKREKKLNLQEILLILEDDPPDASTNDLDNPNFDETQSIQVKRENHISTDTTSVKIAKAKNDPRSTVLPLIQLNDIQCYELEMSLNEKIRTFSLL